MLIKSPSPCTALKSAFWCTLIIIRNMPFARFRSASESADDSDDDDDETDPDGMVKRRLCSKAQRRAVRRSASSNEVSASTTPTTQGFEKKL